MPRNMSDKEDLQKLCAVLDIIGRIMCTRSEHSRLGGLKGLFAALWNTVSVTLHIALPLWRQLRV
jgi:hypothetical protein